MKRFVLAPFLAALAMFFWGFLYWGASHHLPYKALESIPNESDAALALGKMFPNSGTYLLPSPLSGEENMAKLSQRGPVVEVNIVKDGISAMDPVAMVKGFIHMFVLSVILAVMLNGLNRSFETWTCRVKFCALIGFLVAVCDLGNTIWWHHAWGWTLVQSFYDFMMYVIAGLVLAKFLTPKVAGLVRSAA